MVCLYCMEGKEYRASLDSLYFLYVSYSLWWPHLAGIPQLAANQGQVQHLRTSMLWMLEAVRPTKPSIEFAFDVTSSTCLISLILLWSQTTTYLVLNRHLTTKQLLKKRLRVLYNRLLFT